MMTQAEALEVVCEAAAEWSGEICQYIVPDGMHEPEDKRALWKRSDEIELALCVVQGIPTLDVEKQIPELWEEREEELAE